MYISSLRLSGNELDNYSYEAEQSGDRQLLSSLSKVNFIVGPNNSGKSRLLRKIFSSQKISFQPVASLTSVSEIRKDIITGIETILNGSQNISDLKEQSQALPDIRIMTESTDAMKALGDIAHTLSTVGSAGTYTHTNMLNLSRSLEQLNLLGDSIKTRLESAGKALLNNTTFSKFYIPTLRSLRFIDAPNIPDIFLETTKRDYFSQGHQTIFSGLKLRSEMEEMRLGDREQRLALDKFEKYLGNSFFGGRDIQLIPKYNSRTLHIKIGNEDQFASEHLGDGIQMVIILTFLLFKDPKQQKLIFIEEPELFLHPGMQRMVLEKFLSSTNTQFFIATHSNHLLDMTLDDKNISIFTSTKDLTSEGDIAKAKFTIRNVSRSDRQTLDLLGIRNSSVFLSNCTVWIEGITDRRYLTRYLELYVANLRLINGKENHSYIFEPKEDLHYSFLEYSGSNITHWSFLDNDPDPIQVDFLCGKLFLITDKDNASGRKQERFEKLNKSLGDRYYCLQCKEMENLISPTVLKKIVVDYEDNSSDIKDIKYDDYKDQSLGTYIEKTMLKSQNRRGKYAQNSGTITDKIGFCERAVRIVNDFSDLSEEAQHLTEKVYRFIANNNGN